MDLDRSKFMTKFRHKDQIREQIQVLGGSFLAFMSLHRHQPRPEGTRPNQAPSAMQCSAAGGGTGLPLCCRRQQADRSVDHCGGQ